MIKIFMFIFLSVSEHAGGKKRTERLTDSLRSHSLVSSKKLCNHKTFFSFQAFSFAYCQQQHDSKHLINENRNSFLFASRLSFDKKKYSSLIITFCLRLIRFYYWISQSDCIDFSFFPRRTSSLACLSAVFIQEKCISKFICANKADKSM